MAGEFVVIAEGIGSLKEFDSIKDEIRLAAVKAINKTADSGRALAARQIRDQVNFPAQYLTPAGKRLFVSKKATKADLEARIRARTRATSLARFVQGTPTPNKPGVRVEVSPGKARFLKRAFVIRLKAGSANLDTKSNLGLAVRLKPGETLRNKSDVRRLERGLYLLYGPSVDQVFAARDGTGVAEDISPDLVNKMEDEFLRLLELRNG